MILHKKMSLLGKNKKKTSYKVSMKTRNTNKTGYRVKEVEKSGGTCVAYLVKPNKKKIRLCSFSYY